MPLHDAVTGLRLKRRDVIGIEQIVTSDTTKNTKTPELSSFISTSAYLETQHDVEPSIGTLQDNFQQNVIQC